MWLNSSALLLSSKVFACHPLACCLGFHNLSVSFPFAISKRSMTDRSADDRMMISVSVVDHAISVCNFD
jgi:hypothetical protein